MIRGTTSIGVLAAFIQYAQRFFRPIQDFSEKYNILQAAMASGERVFKLLDTPAEIVSPAITKTPQGPGRIEFDHVWFAYRDIRTRQMARRTPHRMLPLSNQAGFSATLVSRSNQAKPSPSLATPARARRPSFLCSCGSTMCSVVRFGSTGLISKTWTCPTSAAVSAWCCKTHSFSPAQSKAIFASVQPEITDADVEKAAGDVNLTEFIRALPQGFKEEVRERGSTLSTGQKQLISFARALAHNPKILILDEATSSVDTETEFRVRDALSRMVEGRTSLIIAHRLSTIQRANKIIVMHKGKVREMGTHQQLLSQRGIYWKLYQLQYKDQEMPATPQVTANADD